MTWLMWRQHRIHLLVTAGVVAALGLYMLVSGRDAALVLSWLPVLPLLVGVFWGAPLLAREVEQGTHRLVWTQSVTRRRWLVVKLTSLGLAVTVTGLVLGLMVTVWVTSVGADRFGNTALFGGTGVAVGAWWLFAFLLGAASGGVLRRTIPAIAVTVAVFVAAMVGVFQARDEYATPLTAVSEWVPEGAAPGGGTWLSSSGEQVDAPPECVAADTVHYLSCVEDAGYRAVIFYQPADRYWRFQWTETGLLSLGALLLAGPVVYRVLRRPV